MIKPIRNALKTLLEPAVGAMIRDEIAAQRESERKEVRALVHEMEDMLEKFARVAARTAMRRSRELRRAVEDEQQPDQVPLPSRVFTAQERKAQLRRAHGIGTQVHHHQENGQ